MVNAERRSLNHQLFAAWCGPISTVLVLAWALLAHALPPIPAATSPRDTLAFMVAHHDGIMLGCTVGLVAVFFLTIWVAQLCLMMARIEGRAPLWAICEGIAGAGTLVFFAAAYVFWIGAAFRLDTDPRIVVALNDAAFFCFLLTWPTASLQAVACAMAGLGDASERPLFPRGLCYLAIAAAIVLAGAAGPAFTDTGVFAYDGALGYYAPLAFFGLWSDAMSIRMILVLLDERRRLAAQR